MMKKREILGWGLAFAAMIIMLSLCNSVIMMFLPSDRKAKKVTDMMMESSEATYGGIDVLRYHDDLLESLEITGWTFASTLEDNSNKTVSLMLRSAESGDYLIEEVPLTVREDIYVTFRKTVPMVGKNHGFSAKIATFNMPDGVYDIYVYSHENESSYGWYKMGRSVEKKNKRVEEKATELVTISDVESEKITYAIDSFTVDELGIVQINGWGIIEGETVQNFYLRMENENIGVRYYTMNRTSRYDIARVYGESNKETGFQMTLSSGELPDGEIKLSLVIETGSGLYRSADVKTYRNEGNNTLTYIDVAGTDFSSANTDPVSSDRIKESVVSDHVYVGINSVLNVNTHLWIDGWAALTMSEPIEEVYFEVITETDEKYLYEALTFEYENTEIDHVYGENWTGIRGNAIIDYIQPNTTFAVRYYVKTENSVYAQKEPRFYDMLSDRRIEEHN